MSLSIKVDWDRMPQSYVDRAVAREQRLNRRPPPLPKSREDEERLARIEEFEDQLASVGYRFG